MTHGREHSGRVVTIVVAALLGALLTALLLPDRTPSGGFTAGRDETSGLPAHVMAAVKSDEDSTRWPVTAPPGQPAVAPRLLRIPRLGLRMPVVPRGVDDRGAMALPVSAFALAWYRFGSRPLDRAGATVLAGHVDTKSEGIGPLTGLAGLRTGDLIELRAGRAYGDLPHHIGDPGQQGPHRLVRCLLPSRLPAVTSGHVRRVIPPREGRLPGQCGDSRQTDRVAPRTLRSPGRISSVVGNLSPAFDELGV